MIEFEPAIKALEPKSCRSSAIVRSRKILESRDQRRRVLMFICSMLTNGRGLRSIPFKD